ncbi:MAG: TRAP transporter substrate-binding protein DctP [Clostridiales bacterium]|nr:TRAP transporter substrate-binding protein DctP [Clostridiales bacterium]
MKISTSSKFLCLFLAAAMALSGCGSGGSSSAGNSSGGSSSAGTDENYELIFASQDAEGLPSTNMMHWIADEVESRTDGHVTFKIYPSNQLGDAKLLYEGVMDGSIDMYLGYLDPTYDIVFDITTIPFLASNYDQIGYIMSSESNCYKLFDEHCTGTDMIFLGFFLNGVNGIFSAKPLGNYLDPNEHKDALIRIASSTTYQLGIEALGYATVTIPWSDTYTSMQTGVMDGMTGIPSYMVEQNFGDITKYYLAMDEFLETNVIIMSPSTKDKLPEEYMSVIEDVCAEVAAKSVTVT